MNNKITLPELVDAIAELTNTSKRVSELFLKELFGVIKERLEQGETVKIKNLGTFKVTEIAARKSVNVNTGEDMEIAAHRRVSFTPDKSLAEAINTPFEGFETIALDDNITEEGEKEADDQ
jgi:nucleoid DNA-binding protein